MDDSLLQAGASSPTWSALCMGGLRAEFERDLPGWLSGRRWFGGKARAMSRVALHDLVPLGPHAALALVRAEFAAAEPEFSLLALVREPAGVRPAADTLPLGTDWRLADAPHDPRLIAALWQLTGLGAQADGQLGQLRGQPAAWPRDVPVPAARLLAAEQSNSSVQCGDELMLKLYRRVEPGVNPDLELTAHLSAVGNVPVPRLAGALSYHPSGGEAWTLGMWQQLVPSRSDAWQSTLERLRSFAARTLPAAVLAADPAAQAEQQFAQLLGRRTAELHAALAQDLGDPSFTPEPWTSDFAREFSASATSLIGETFIQLAAALDDLPAGGAAVARQVLAAQPQLVARLAGLLERPPRTLRIRCHGDYHLGQVLTTGDDFVIIDFEGEPTRSLAQRRAKQPPLRDVAGMLRSLDYARHVAQDLLADAPGGHSARRLAWWQEAASASFLAGYRAHLPPGELVPADPAEFQRLLDVFLLEKAVYEVAYELNHRPAWASIPLTALARLSGSG